MRQEAHALRNEIVQGLTSQSPGGEALKPPSPLTIAARQLEGFGGSKALIVRGDLRNSIIVVVQGDEAFIGVSRSARSKDGASMMDLAKLNEFGGPPVFVTSDRIPTVRAEIETHVVAPTSDFCGFEEIPAVHFSGRLAREAERALAGRRPSFVYQRYGLFTLAGLDLACRLGVPLVLEYNGSEVWITRHWAGKPLRHERLALEIESLIRSAAAVAPPAGRGAGGRPEASDEDDEEEP